MKHDQRASAAGPGSFEQLKAITVTLVLAVGGTVVLAYVVKALVGLRPELDEERMGLDVSDHGESAYNY